MIIQHPASPLAASWLSQLRHLNSSLSEESANALACHWRIRIKVLSFLVSRYGDDPSLAFERRGDTTNTYIPDIEVQDKPLRSRQAIRKTLNRIAEANQYKPV